MIRLAISGLGRMGNMHLSIYEQLVEEGYPLKIVAICDVDKYKLEGKSTAITNLVSSAAEHKFDEYNHYTSLTEMLEKEKLDVVDVVMPTHLHADAAIEVLNHGIHCFCEKPMSTSVEDCTRMIDAANKAGKNLMIGHCLHFWREYAFLNDCVKDKTYGDVLGGYFWRGGWQDHVANPSWNNWILKRECGGGAIFDQHVHDVEAINWIFGTPKAVSSLGKTNPTETYLGLLPDDGKTYNIVNTNYIYEDNKVITALDDTAYIGYPFGYGFRVNLERATIAYENGKLTVYTADGNGVEPDLSSYGNKNAYYNEFKYYLDCVSAGVKPTKLPPETSREAIHLTLCEVDSCDKQGQIVSC